MSSVKADTPELVVALDFQEGSEAMAMARILAPSVSWVKVGLELFTRNGPGVVEDLKGLGLKVFLDLKFFDIPNTVKGAVRSAAALGADMVNIHAMGGRAMALAALEGRDAGTPPGEVPPLLLAVTVLTSMDESDLPVAGIKVEDMVLDLARKTRDNGLDGVVCSAWEALEIKRACGSGFLCLTPGIRPQYSVDDQKRIMTPSMAVLNGSDFLVAGRPVTDARAPLDAARGIQAEISQAIGQGA